MKKYLLLFIVSLIVKKSFSQSYTFIGNGNWTISTNWSNNTIPPSTLPSGSIIYITPIVGDTCILNVVQTISSGANFIVSSGANFIIVGDLIIDGPIIPSVTICNQVWMAKNLDVTTYRNGDPIPQITDPSVWASLTTGAWCWYNNDSSTYASTYGKLYNGYAVIDPRGLAPLGWHIPSYNEWRVDLESCLGSYTIAGGKMKEVGTVHWTSPNTGATNSSGFTGLPGGRRDNVGTFAGLHFIGMWWSSTQTVSGTGNYICDLYYSNIILETTAEPYTWGLSIRCLKD